MEFKKFDVNATIDAFEKQTESMIGFLPEKAQHQAEALAEANFKLVRLSVDAVNDYTETVMQVAKDVATSANETFKAYSKLAV